jgi:hypothetical protein
MQYTISKFSPEVLSKIRNSEVIVLCQIEESPYFLKLYKRDKTVLLESVKSIQFKKEKSVKHIKLDLVEIDLNGNTINKYELNT